MTNSDQLKEKLQKFHQQKLQDQDFFVNNHYYTAGDLIVRQYLNNGKNGFGMTRVKAGYEYILKNKQALIDNNMLSESAKNNSGAELWKNYKF